MTATMLVVRWKAIIVATLVAFICAVPAQAQRPGDVSSADQYVEDIPTGEGKKPVGSDAGDGTRLAQSVQSELAQSGGDDAGLLSTIATSPAFGAPSGRLKAKGAEKGIAKASSADAADASVGGTLSTAAGSFTSGEGGRSLGALIVVLILVSAALTGSAIMRSRRRRDPSA